MTSRGSEARRLAVGALVAVERGQRANAVVPALLDASELDERDRALVYELVFGTCRMRRACDWLLDRHLRSRTDEEVRSALRVGAYQLTFLNIPPHAAVSATVSAVAGPGRSVVNAVLRRVAASLPARWPDPATELSYPDWIVRLLAEDLGPKHARGALEAMNVSAPTAVRPDGYRQDPASQMVAEAVRAGTGELLLDLCAAPGGKASALAYGPGGPAGASGGDGMAAASRGPRLVVAADVDPGRAALVSGAALRLGLPNLAVVVADGTRPAWRPRSFTRVLVDAPCSGLGALRRRPDARWRVQPGDMGRLVRLQKQLLSSAAGLLAPGGTLAYSVCTLSRMETVGIDMWLREHHPELRALPPPGDPWQPLGRGGLLLPQTAGTDGMYLLLLVAPGAGSGRDPGGMPSEGGTGP